MYRIRPYFSVVAHSPDWAEIRYGVWNATSCTLRDESNSGTLTRLLLRLDGSSSAGEIAASENVAESEVEQLLHELDAHGIIETEATNALDFVLDRTPGARGARIEAPPLPMPVVLVGDTGLFDPVTLLLHGSLPGAQVLRADGATLDALRDLAGPDEDTIAFAAGLAGFGHWRDHLVIAMQRVIDPDLAHKINRICLALKTPWLHAALDGPFLLIGPLTVPNRSACFDCFETRVMMNLRESASYQRYKRAIVGRLIKLGTVPVEPVVSHLLAGHTSMEALSFLLTSNSCLIGKVLSVYLPTMEFSYHDILRVPACRSCGARSATMRRELHFDVASVVDTG